MPARVGLASLLVLDSSGHTGDPFLRIEVTVLAAAPSAAGAGLLDILLEDGPLSPPPLAARPIWDLWHAGRPHTTGMWAGLGTAARREWVHAALIRHRTRPDDEPGAVYHQDGASITDDMGFCAPSARLSTAWAATSDGAGTRYGTA